MLFPVRSRNCTIRATGYTSRPARRARARCAGAVPLEFYLISNMGYAQLTACQHGRTGHLNEARPMSHDCASVNALPLRLCDVASIGRSSSACDASVHASSQQVTSVKVSGHPTSWWLYSSSVGRRRLLTTDVARSGSVRP